jgi:hypothetical protein
MLLKFRIIQQLFPKTFKDFKDYIICKIHVVDCSKKEYIGTEKTFKGILPSCAPYFIYECSKGIVEIREQFETVLKGSSSCVYTLHEDLRVNGLIHMLMHEFPRANDLYDENRARKHTAQTALSLVQQMVNNGDIVYDETQKIDVQLIMDLPIMNDAVLDSCDLFRINYIRPLSKLFPKKALQQLTKMTAASLQFLKHTLETDPIKLCLRTITSEKPLCVKPMTYDAFITCTRRMNAITYKPYEMCSIRILDYFRSMVIEDTAMAFETLKTKYLALHAGDTSLFEQSFWHLVRLKELDYDQGSKMVCESNQMKKCKFIVRAMEALCQRQPNGTTIFRDIKHGRVPCIPKQLTDEQTRAALHTLHHPLTMVVGPPGRGKTSLVEFALCYFRRACVVSFVGTNVASHRERINGRAEASNTAHYVFHTADSTVAGKKWASSFDALVWDELSNVSEGLMSNVLRVLTELSRFIGILDPWQLHPIKAGMPGLDLIDAFPDCVFPLNVNLRTNPRARQLADAIIYVLKGEHTEIDWSFELKERACMTALDPGVPITHGDEHGALKKYIYRVLKEIMLHPDIYNVKGIMDIQFIVLKNKTRIMINDMVEHCGRELGLLPKFLPEPTLELASGLILYKGCKICIRGESFSATENNRFNAIRNGDCGVITKCTNTEQGMVVEFSSGTMTKRMLLDKQVHVDPSAIHLGHAITVNASQGCEYNTVIGIFHDGTANNQWVCRAHAYVMSSRAKEAFILIANDPITTFERVCQRLQRRRETMLRHLLKTLKIQQQQDMETTTPMEIVSPDLLTLDTDREQPCVPILEQFVDENTHEKKRKLHK